jgi:hypothetical protein
MNPQPARPLPRGGGGSFAVPVPAGCRPLRANRWWLALSYVLATVLAQGLHDHGRGDDPSAAGHEAGCADACRHVTGHPSDESGPDRADCPACQFRADHHSWAPCLPGQLRESVSVTDEAPRPLTLSGPTFRATSRAPPRV